MLRKNRRRQENSKGRYTRKPKFFRPMLEELEDRTLLSQVTWISTQSGFWDVGSNWSSGQAPTASDNVTINQPGVTVTIRDAEAAGTLSGSDVLSIVSGGSLNVANASTFGGNVSVSSGGSLSVSGTTTLSGNLNNAGALTVQAGTLNISGTVSQVSGTSLTGGDWNVANGATLDLSSAPSLTTNAATVSLSGSGAFTQLASITSDSGSLSLVDGANFSSGGDFTISGSLSDDTGQLNLNGHQLTIGSGGTLSLGNASGLTNVIQVTNAGTFQVFAGNGNMTLGTFNNQGGTIDVESGTLQTTGGTSTGGTFIVKPQAVYQPATPNGFIGSTAIWTGTYTGSGGGTVLFTNPFGDDSLQIGANSTDTATFDFPEGMFQFQAGNILGPGTLINAQGGFLSLTSSGAPTNLGNNNPIVLDNKGTILHASTGQLTFGTGAVLDNESTGIYNFQAAGSFGGNNGFNGLGTVNNQGTFEMSGNGTAQIQIAFNNQGGTIDVESGTLQTAGGTFTGGTFVVKPQAFYEPAAQGATTIWTGTFTGSGGGAVLLTPIFPGNGTIQIGTTSGDTATLDLPSGMFQWQGGNIIGPGTLINAAGGFLSFTGTNANMNLGNNNPVVLDNKGTILHTGTGTLVFGTGAVLDNESSAVYNFQAAGSFGGNNGSNNRGTVNNQGTFEMSTASGTSSIPITFNNQGGTIDVESGTLQTAGGTFTGGTFIVKPQAVYELAAFGSTVIWTGTYTGSGGGTVLFTPIFPGAGSIQIGTSSSDTVTFDFPSGMFQWQGGNIDGPGTLTNSGDMQIAGNGSSNSLANGATLINSGTMTLNIPGGVLTGDSTSQLINRGIVHWINGSLSVAFLNDRNGTLSMEGDAEKVLDGKMTIDNRGTIDQGGNGTLSLGSAGAFGVSPGALTNEAGAVYDFTGDGGIVDALGTGFFNNVGEILKTGGTGTSRIGIGSFATPGPIEVDRGTLALDVPAASYSGFIFTANAGGTLELDGGRYAGTFTGSGTVLLAGSITIGMGGIISKVGNFEWTSGSINSQLGDFTNLGTMTLNGTSDLGFFEAGTLDNKGTIVQIGAGNLNLDSNSSFPSTLKNEAGAVFDMEADSGIDNVSNDNRPPGPSAILNDGTIRKSAGLGTSTILANGTLDNSGTIEADSGTLALSGSIPQVAGSTLVGGAWNALNGATLALPGGTNITANQANLTVDGKGASITGIGNLASNSGDLSVTNGASLAIPGDFSNSGNLVLGVGSTLAVKGGYTQSATGTLETQLGGAPASGQFGQLTATGAASLNGMLQVLLANGYAPSASDSFRVMTYASHTGSFAAIEQPIFRGGDLFQVQTIAGNVTLTAATAVADLKVTSVSTTAASVQTGQNLTVNYTVQNVGNATSATSWVDSVFLSASGKLDPSAILLGRVSQTGPLAADGSYSGSLATPVPIILPGNYSVIVETDSRGLVPDSNRANNVLASPTPVQVSVPVLPFSPAGGKPTPVNIALAPSQQMVFQLAVPAPNNVLISAGTGTTQFLVGYGAIPTASANVATSQAHFLRGVQALLVDAQAGTYYVVVQNQSFANTTSASLTAQAVPFGITNVSPNSIPDLGEDFEGPPFTTEFFQGVLAQQSEIIIHGTPQQGSVTITVSGNGFTPSTTVSLTGNAGPSSPPATVQAQSVAFKDSHTLFATFTLDQLRRFSFDSIQGVGQIVPLDVQVSDNGQTADFQDGVELAIPEFSEEQILNGDIPPPGFTANLITPGDVRVGRPYSVTINYSNTAGVNVPAPLLELSGQGAEFQLPGQSAFTPNSILLFAGNPNGEAGVLPPGFSGSITVTVLATTSGQINFQLGVADPNAAIDWNSQKSSLRPPGTPNAAWDAIFSNFTSEVGTTMGGLQTALDNDASYLSQLGEYTSDVNTLLEFQIEQAGDFGAIAQRYTPGIFGLGISDPTLTAVTDAQGNVNIISGSTVRPFTLQADGSYQGSPGDFATLTLTNGIYQLRETDGTLEVFNPNGTLNFIEDTNGNKLVYGYTGNQLISITSTLNGDVTTFTYNAQGFVSQITDPEGRVTSLTYDSAGHLLSVTDSLGTTSYTYVTSGTPPQLGALASITNPDGSQLNFTYNSQGQLIGQTQNGGADPLTFSYNVGTITTTDALNDKTTALLNDNEQVAEVIDPLGSITDVGYNSNLEPTSIGLPGGLTTSITSDALGNPISFIGPLGQQTTATYNRTFSAPQTVTDPLGNSLNYSYDSNANLLGMTYPDGSSQQYEYNALGQVTQFTNRNGQAIAYTYYPNGLLKSETFPDGSQDSFTYDNHRNLVSMTDSTGTTTFAYDSADRLSKVTYPDGSFLSYTYNSAGQRIQMTDQTGFTVNYQHDALGRLSKLTDADGNLLVSYSYDPAGRLSSKQFGNGDVTNYTYDAAGNVMSIVNLAPDGKTVQSSNVYTYNNQNLPVTMTTSAGTFTYGYDADGQLTSVKTPSGQTITYQYDCAGNRIAVVDNGTTTSYTTNNLNEYTQVGNTTYQYDANGDLISSTNSSGTTNYAYNVLGQLVTVASPTGTTTYQYNALGQRVSDNVNGTVTNLLVDPSGQGNVVGQFTSSGSPVAQYAYGLGLASQTMSNGSNNFYSFDLTGNTTQLTGPTGSVLNAYSYLPFGEQLSASGSTPNPFTYVGQYGVMNDGSGLDFMRNRWYDPGLGRFTEPDPTGLGGGSANFYKYADNSPVALIDPSGFHPDGFGSIGPIPPPGGTGGSGEISAGQEAETTGGNVAQKGIQAIKQAIKDLLGDIPSIILVPLPIFNLPNILNPNAKPPGEANNPPPGESTAVSLEPPEKGTDLSGLPKSLADGFNIFTKTIVHILTAVDPNDIAGPTGFGTQGFIPANSTLPYRIDFTNEASATAPAEVVTVTEQLDSNLDLSTFQLGDLGFGNTIIQVPAGLTSYSTTVNLPSTAPDAGPNGLEVEIKANLNPKTGLVTWTFTGIDPTTQDIPIDPSVGFLPPDVAAPEGEGFVSYTIQPKSTVTASTPINAQATVVFDTNPSLNTQQVSNTLDPVAPTSSVNPLSATITSPTFNVSWSGQDNSGGSGIATFSVFVSDNSGPFTPLLTNTTQTATTFTGQVGHTYSFFSVAVDNVGNLQPLPAAAQATITVVLPPSPPPPLAPPAPPTLQVPPLLAFIDSLLGGVETVNANGTETITDFFFGFPLFVSTFDSSGNLENVDLFGFLDITFLFA